MFCKAILNILSAKLTTEGTSEINGSWQTLCLESNKINGKMQCRGNIQDLWLIITSQMINLIKMTWRKHECIFRVHIRATLPQRSLQKGSWSTVMEFPSCSSGRWQILLRRLSKCRLTVSTTCRGSHTSTAKLWAVCYPPLATVCVHWSCRGQQQNCREQVLWFVLISWDLRVCPSAVPGWYQL